MMTIVMTMKFHTTLILQVITVVQYLVGDLDKEDEDNDDKQVVKDANSSNDDVDDLQYKVTGV